MAVELTSDSEFESKIKNNNKVVVKYFADWCGSCRLFAPKYKRLASDPRFEKITFLDVNAEHSPEARRKAGVTTLPFFAIFKNGELVEAISATKEDVVDQLIEKLN